MASNKQRDASTSLHNELNNSSINKNLPTSYPSLNQKNQTQINLLNNSSDNATNKKKKKKLNSNCKTNDLSTKNNNDIILPFNYQNLNVNINPNEKILQGQISPLSKTGLIKDLNSQKLNNFKQDNQLESDKAIKLKITTAKKTSSSSNSELRKLRIPNQNFNQLQNDEIKLINIANQDSLINKNNLINLNTKNNSINLYNKKNLNEVQRYNGSSNDNNLKNLNLSNSELEFKKNELTSKNNLKVQSNDFLSNSSKVFELKNNLVDVKQKVKDINVIKPKVSPVEAASGIFIPYNSNFSKHEENCMCWMHAGKGKKHPKDFLGETNEKKDSTYLSSSSCSSSSSSSTTSSRSSSCSKESGNCKHHSYNSHSSQSRSSSSSSSSYSSKNSSNCSTSSCSKSYSSTSFSRSSSCGSCSSRSSSSNSSTSSSCEDLSNCFDAKNNNVTDRSRKTKKDKSYNFTNTLNKKEENFSKIASNHDSSLEKNNFENNLLEKNSENFTQQLLNNVNKSLIKHQRQKNFQTNSSSPFSSDLPSPSNLQFNNNISISQPSSVSCESNCYSPSISLNSPSCQLNNKKRDKAEERQRLRSYRLPHLQQNKDLNIVNKDLNNLKDSKINLKDPKISPKNLKNNSNEVTSSVVMQSNTQANNVVQNLNDKQEKNIFNNIDDSLKKNVNSNETNKINEVNMQKIKKLKTKGLKKKIKMKNSFSEGNEEIKLKKKVKKIKKTENLGDSTSSNIKKIKIKKKEKKLKKLKQVKNDMQKNLILNAKLVDPMYKNFSLNKGIINPQINQNELTNHLSSLNNQQNDFNKMTILMNANLNLGIPPNIDKNTILPSLSNIIKEKNTLTLLSDLNQFASKSISETSLKKNLNTIQKFPERSVSQNEKSPDSGIQSQSDSPNQILNQNIFSNEKLNDSLTSKTADKKKSKKASSKLKSNTNDDKNPKNNNLPKANESLLATVSQISNNNEIKKNPLYHNSSFQNLLKNLQKTSESFASKNLNESTNSMSNSIPNLTMIKPKSVPSDLIALTEILLNMKKNKEEKNSSSSSKDNVEDQKNNVKNKALNSKNLEFSDKNVDSLVKETDLNNFSKKNNFNLSKNHFEKTNEFSFKKISVNQQPNQLNIKNTDLWRNPISVGSPLANEESRSKTKNSKQVAREKNKITLNDNKKHKKDNSVVLEEKTEQLKHKNQKSAKIKVLNKKNESKLKKNLSLEEKTETDQSSKKISDLINLDIYTNDNSLDKNDETNSNQQISSRSVSSLSQNQYIVKSKKKKKKHKHLSKKSHKQIAKLVNLSPETESILINLAESISKLKIQGNKDSKTLNNNKNSISNLGIFKCIKYSKGKKKLTSNISTSKNLNSNLTNNHFLQQSNQFNFSQQLNSFKTDLEIDKSSVSTSRKRRKSSTYNSDLNLNNKKMEKKINQSTNDKAENSNEHSLPLKKRHHRHTENKLNKSSSLFYNDEDYIDSSSSNSVDVNNKKILKKNSQSLVIENSTACRNNKKTKATADILQTTEQKPDNSFSTALSNMNKHSNNSGIVYSQLEATAEKSNAFSKEKVILGLNVNNNVNHHTANSCTTWSNNNKNKSNGYSENKSLEFLNSNKSKNTNVENLKEANQKLIDESGLNVESGPNMVTTRNSSIISSRNLRSNQVPNCEINASKCKNETKPKLNLEKTISKNNNSAKNEKRLLNKTSIKDLNINLNEEKNNSTKNNDFSIDLISNLSKNKIIKPNLNQKSDSKQPQKNSFVKKRRKHNKTGFDKPKKRKKVIKTLNDLNDCSKDLIKEENKFSTNDKNINNLDLNFNSEQKSSKRKITNENQSNSKHLKTDKKNENKSNSEKINEKIVVKKQSDDLNYSSAVEKEPNDDFEETVIKINSVLSTVLVKKSKSNKVKLKGPVKKYLKAGLFSDTFKEDIPSNESNDNNTNTSASNTPVHQCETPLTAEELIQSDNEEISIKNEVEENIDSSNGNEINEGKIRFEDEDAQYNGKEPEITDNDEYSTILPPPTYVYNKYRRKLNDFVLPYDIWWQHVNNQLNHSSNPTKSYKKIKANVFFDVKPITNFDEQSCICVKPKEPDALGCANDCLNRAMFVECNPSLCPCEEKCSNQKLLKNDWAPGLERFLTRNRGWGVRTTNFIKKSSFIIEYIGEVVSEKVFKERMSENYSRDSHHYCLNITSGILIDGYRMANEGRFVNHSCEPNCEMQKWSVNGYYRVGLYSLRDISPGEEVTYDYNFYNFNIEKQQTCHCGSTKCRGVIGGKNQAKLNNQSNKEINSTLNSMEKLRIVKSIMKKSNNKRKDCYLNKVENSGTFDNSISALDKKKFFELIKSFSYTSSKFIRKHNLFLIRNFEKFRQLHNKSVEKKRRLKNNLKQSDIYYMKKNQSKDLVNLTYLKDSDSRSVCTRGLVKVQENEELIKFYKICNIFKETCQQFILQVEKNVKEDENLEEVFNLVKDIPKKRQNDNNQLYKLNLINIERNILSGVYKTEEAFINEIKLLFENLLKHFEKDSLQYAKASYLENLFFQIFNENMSEYNRSLESSESINKKKLKLDDKLILGKLDMNLSVNHRIYLAAITQTSKEIFSMLYKNNSLHQSSLQNNLNNENTSCHSQELQRLQIELPKFKKIEEDEDEDEEIIRCICSYNKDDGTMIQCDKCNCWQHADCMKANINAETYLCEICDPRDYDKEIQLSKAPVDGVEGWTYYFTFLIGKNIIKQGDCVYLERDKSKNANETNFKNSSCIKDFDGNYIPKSEVDIFRIEHLYKNSEGKKFVYGHHCLRPSETFHEPTRKFFSNEVLSSPLGGSAPLDSVKGICYVLDLSTFCKGRPIGANEDDVYICDFKVCKKARSFTKVAKGYFAVNMKPYCFNYFEERLNPRRNFSPHDTSMFKKENKNLKIEKKQVEPEKVKKIDLTQEEIVSINKLHLQTFVEKQFNINKIIEKINLLNEDEISSIKSEDKNFD